MLVQLLRNMLRTSPTSTVAEAQSKATGTPNEQDQLVESAYQALEKGDVENALKLAQQSILINTAHPPSHLVLSRIFHESNQLDQALKHAQFAERLTPNGAQYVNQVGIVHMSLGNFGMAKKQLKRAHQLSPQTPEILNNLGLSYRHLGDPQKAKGFFRQALECSPQFNTARMNLALCNWETDQASEAENDARLASQAEPDNLPFQFNLAAILLDLGNLDEAKSIIRRLEQAHAAEDEIARFYTQIALQKGDWDAAESEAQRAARVAPTPQNRYTLAEVQLTRGNYGEGWENYDQRLAMPGFPFRFTPIPRWQGEPLAGKRIYIQSEQGIGDQIMFASCLNDLKNAGAEITMECDVRLAPLMERSLPGIRVIGHSGTLPPYPPQDGYDFSTYIGSLPRWTRSRQSSFNKQEAYLKGNPELIRNWHDRLPANPKIAVCWRGGLLHTGRLRRSLKVEDLAVLGNLPATLISVQRDETQEEKEIWKQQTDKFIPFASELEDLDQLAGLLCNCDAVVTACCSVAHVAGALGLTTIVLTPVHSAWRYGAQGTRMNWYPSVMLIRQSRPDDWRTPTLNAVSNLVGLLARLA